MGDYGVASCKASEISDTSKTNKTGKVSETGKEGRANKTNEAAKTRKTIKADKESKRERRVRAVEGALLIALCVSLCAGTWAEGRQIALSGGLVRLHVVAVSDEESEQALKLQVRNAVLEYIEPRLKGVESTAEARETIRENLNGIARAAAESAEGRGVRVTLGKEQYPTRRYAGFALPAGEYESLKVVIGEGEGQNWWCVVFPPLCTGGVEASEVRAAMTGDNYALITESDSGYTLKFKTLELWGELQARLRCDTA